jgi:hypothetical protein
LAFLSSPFITYEVVVTNSKHDFSTKIFCEEINSLAQTKGGEEGKKVVFVSPQKKHSQTRARADFFHKMRLVSRSGRQGNKMHFIMDDTAPHRTERNEIVSSCHISPRSPLA